MKSHYRKRVIAVILGIMSSGSVLPAYAGSDVTEAVALFREVCLTYPLQTQKSLAILSKLEGYETGSFGTPKPGNLLMGFQDSTKPFGGGLQEFKGKINCNVGFQAQGDGREDFTKIAAMVAAIPGVSGPLAIKKGRRHKFAYKGFPLVVKKKNKRIQMILSNK